MPELSSIHLPDSGNNKSLKKVIFDKSPKMSTYLLAWAVGEFDFVQGTTKGGVSIRVITPPGRGLQGKFALDVGMLLEIIFIRYINVTYIIMYYLY